MQLTNIIVLLIAASATAVEGRGFGGRGRAKTGGGKTGGGKGATAKKGAEIAGGAMDAAGTVGQFWPAKGSKQVHNCCRNNGPAGGGWINDDWAKSLTKGACKNLAKDHHTIQTGETCTEAAGWAISGDTFFNACRALITPLDKNIGAGYNGNC